MPRRLTILGLLRWRFLVHLRVTALCNIIVDKAWQRHVMGTDGRIDAAAFTFCVLDKLRATIRRRDVFVSPSWCYADPRAGLLCGPEWDATRSIICRSLGLGIDPTVVSPAAI